MIATEDRIRRMKDASGGKLTDAKAMRLLADLGGLAFEECMAVFRAMMDKTKPDPAPKKKAKAEPKDESKAAEAAKTPEDLI